MPESSAATGSGFVTRFAPSPTGPLHLGHAYSARLAFDAAQRENGRFLLRIEDIDQVRSRPEHEAGILEDLAWLGLSWEEPVLRQSERLEIYRAAVAELVEKGLLYRCFRTRRELALSIGAAPHGRQPVFRGAPLAAAAEAQRLERGQSYAWRLDLDAARRRLGERFDALRFTEEPLEGGRGIPRRMDPERVGDVVIARKDLGVSYHLASVLDDARSGVTHVIRGEDLAEAAHVHTLLQALLGLPQPAYRHHPLVEDASGRRLAKRTGAPALRDLRRNGADPERLLAALPEALRRPLSRP